MYERTSNSGNDGLGREHTLVFAYGDALEIPGVMEVMVKKNINSINNMRVHVVQMIGDCIGLVVTFLRINSTAEY